MTIRRLTPIDSPAYRTLMLEAYALHPDAFTSSHAERAALPQGWWESRLSVEPLAAEIVLGTFLDGQFGGVVGLSFETREKARHKATIFGMYVPSRFRSHGLGRRLLLAAIDCAKARRGVSVIQLTVTEGNIGAQSLYAKCGFLPFGLEPFAVAVGSQFVSKVHMWRGIGLEDVRV